MMLAFKYEQTENIQCIKKIYGYLLEIFQKEQQFFNPLYKTVREWFLTHY